MLFAAIAYSRPMAVGIALAPLLIGAVVSILLSARPTNAPAFLLGWVAGILLIGAIVFVLPGLDTARGEPTPLSGWIRLILGGALLVLAVAQWRRRSSAADPVDPPKLLSRLDTNGAVQTVVIGFLLALNPKNLVLTFAGAAAIDASMATPVEQATALIVFTVVASLTIIIPTIVYFLYTERVRAILMGWKAWLTQHNTAVVTGLLVIFGVFLIGDGLRIL